MSRKKGSKTSCPRCKTAFAIAEHRIYQIKSNYAPFWFFEAVNQFEHFNEVKCPSCGHVYKAKEARLFFLFKSPYTVIVLGILIVLIAIVIELKLSGKM